MKLNKKEKTMVLGNGDNPTWVLFEGHVSIKRFNQSYKNDWGEKGQYDKELIRYGYWTKKELKNGETVFSLSCPENKKSKPYTDARWDY
jgi:hypothetical protein